MAPFDMRAPSREVIPAEQVQAALESLELEVAALDDELTRAEHAADEAERRLAAQRAELAATQSKPVASVQAFVRELEATSERSFRAALAWARNAAEQRKERARADARDLSAHTAPPLQSEAAEPELDARTASLAASAALALVPEQEWPAIEDDFDAEPGEAPAQAFDAAAHSAPVTEADDEERAAEVAQQDPPLHEEFWREEREASRARTLSAIPLEAVLPMIALVIVLVVVLAWVG